MTVQIDKQSVAIVGAGNIGAAYAGAIDASALLSCAAIIDVEPRRGQELAERVGAVALRDLDGLRESELCDFVLVCTPPSLHETHVVSALTAGLDVLCEKPFAIGLDSARRMFGVAEARGRMLAMASKFRYVDDLIRAKELIADGCIGEPVTAEVKFASAVDMSDRWNSVPAISGGGALIDNGTHAVDIIRYLLGPIRRVSAMSTSDGGGSSVEDTGVIIGETNGGAIATMSVSWAVAPVGGSYVAIHGTRGAIDVGWGGSRYRTGSDEWVAFGSGYSKLDALRSNVENFGAARLGTEPMLNSVTDVLASVSVIGAAYQAIANRSWVEIPGVADVQGDRPRIANSVITVVSSG